MADRYLQIDCAVFTPNPSRPDYVREITRERKADGVIHYTLQFCQPYQMEAGPVVKQLEDASIPTLRIDTDYSQEDADTDSHPGGSIRGALATMRAAGIDIGSRTVKLAVLQDGRLVTSKKRENSFDPLAVCRELLTDESYDTLVTTGYGRHLFSHNFGVRVVSEIKASAVGARWLHPACRTVIDLGGQDTKAISLD